MSYRKFIIVSDERTGSNLLQMLLTSHSEIVCRGELLNPSDEHRGSDFSNSNPILGPDDDPTIYLQNTLNAHVPESVRAVGFRLQYSHARQGAWKKARDEIVIDKDIRIVHLTRENLLDRYLSYCLAMRNGRWIETHESPPSPDEMISLDLEDCVKDIARCEWYQDETEEIFSSHSRIHLTYENLCANTELETRRVLQFLGVEYQPLQSPTKKQRRKKKREMIQNFEDLKSSFNRGIAKGWSNPRWCSFFDEN